MIRKIIHIDEEKCNGWQKYLPVLRNCPFFTGLTDDEILSILHCVSATKIQMQKHPQQESIDMIRKIIHIDEEKCNGCGLCATACHEGAIDIINGKAKLVRENFCDGFGDCLPGCPTGAITFEEREAPAYDEAAVQENKKKKELQEKMKHLHEGGCPGSRMRMLEQQEAAESVSSAPVQSVSRLRNWPVQIKLAPSTRPTLRAQSS